MRQYIEVAIPRIDLELHTRVRITFHQQDTVSQDAVDEVHWSRAQVDQVHRPVQQPLEIPPQSGQRAKQSSLGRPGQQHRDVHVAVDS
jgi:hypothetical protein